MNYLLSTANRIAKAKGLLRDNVLKELMHYDILSMLASCKIVPELVFQGGTAIRLCYGSQRFADDLDFVCGLQVIDSTALETSLLKAA